MKTAERQKLQTLWKQRIHDWQHSGLSQTEWCKQHQLNHHQLGYWKRKLLSKADDKLIPLAVINSEPTAPSQLVLYIDSIRVEAAPEQAAALIKALQAVS